MGENDITKDTTENGIPADENTALENVDVEDVSDTHSEEEIHIADENVISVEAYESYDKAEGASESQFVQHDDTDTDKVYDENMSDEDVVPDAEDTSAEESKDHKADLAGYRAYRKKNIKPETEVSVKKETKKDAKPLFNLKTGSFSVFIIVLAAFTLIDLFTMHLFTSKQAYNLSDKILAALGFDALHFTDITYEQICLGLGYFVAFIFGGVCVLILMKILSKLFECFTDWKIGRHCPIIALGIFAIIFAIGFAVSYFSKDAILVTNVFRWGAPAAAYLGGLVFYGASKLHIGIEY